MPDLNRTNADNIDFNTLIVLLDKDLGIRDGDEHAFYAQFNKIDMIRNAVVCYMDNKPVACGAFKPYENEVVEIKRMYTLPAYRGKGIAHKVLNELERWASELGYKACVLETGKKQPEAISLYRKAGYVIIHNYGQYKNVENSICMKKIIV